MSKDNSNKNWYDNKNGFKRHFTVRVSSEKIDTLSLSLLALHQMELEFNPQF